MGGGAVTGIVKLVRFPAAAIRALDFVAPAVDLAARLWLANVFWKSGLTKIASWDSTLSLFNYVYSVPLLPPELAAVLATGVELGGSVLLALGLGARFGTAALFILNLTAAYSFADISEAGLKDHFFWGLLLLVFFVHGPGKLSFDHWIRKWLMTGERALFVGAGQGRSN
jgi:putative oxidoreductase